MNQHDVIIIGGSYAGLSAAMALGRSLRKVLIVDSGSPCNQQTPHSHNFIMHDGETPAELSRKAKEQVLKYDSVEFLHDFVTTAKKFPDGFEIQTKKGETYKAKKLLFASGIFDIFPEIKGFAECWGISALHCPYCHGYEVRQKNIGVIGNGDMGFEYCRLISNWSSHLTLFTNGPSTMTITQRDKIKSHNIEIVEAEIYSFDHTNGLISQILFKDGSKKPVEAIFARVPFRQHTAIPEQMGCELTEQGFIKIDDFHRTSISGVYAAGDNSTMLRAVSNAVSGGTRAGAFINKDIIDEEF